MAPVNESTGAYDAEAQSGDNTPSASKNAADEDLEIIDANPDEGKNQPLDPFGFGITFCECQRSIKWHGGIKPFPQDEITRSHCKRVRVG